MIKFIQPDWPAPKTIKAYTTTRQGWKTTLPFQADKLKGSQESQQLQALLHLPDEPIWLKQTHSNIAIEATLENTGATADASFATRPNHICVVQTADCLPVLICNQHGTHVAAIHAGWRGLANGIIENTVNALQQPAQTLLVWLGPAIGPSIFEVGSDVYQAFTNQNKQAESAFQPINKEKWLGNLYQLARLRLQSLGITSIYGGNHCTHTQPELFYSYRRDQGQTGRMASLIWIDHRN